MLYNEGPFVGQPSFGVYVKGCSLRCRFCYRADDLEARGAPTTGAGALASILDAASDGGAESWHFLGGNPDESLVGILEALRMTQSTRPVVWNSALYVTPESLKLLKGLVDVWVPDLKFGSDQCARELAGISRYSSVIQRNLQALADERFLVVRHMSYPGHEHCCADFVSGWVRENLPNAVMQPLRLVPVHRRRSVRASICLGGK
jgi:putative pyruvate formate lyase activating enzyme